jgi:hypothetical protein
MAVKLHRCSTRWKFGQCWRVQRALDEQGIAYEVVKGPARPGSGLTCSGFLGRTSIR